MSENEPTPELLPKPIDEMTADELFEFFPDNKKPYVGRVVGRSALGPIVEMPQDLVEGLLELRQQSIDS